jgi:hypothetical protein
VAVLLLHGLYPIGAETRSRNALEVIKPYLRSGGYELQDLKLEDGQLKPIFGAYQNPSGI